jgi:uncharacterized tellurite resistance protein B-like protein
MVEYILSAVIGICAGVGGTTLAAFSRVRELDNRMAFKIQQVDERVTSFELRAAQSYLTRHEFQLEMEKLSKMIERLEGKIDMYFLDKKTVR